MSPTEIEAEHAPVKTKPSVLELRDVTFVGKSEHSISLAEANLILREGELAVLHLDPLQNSREIASMMEGLIQPNDGKVLFQNEAWLGEDYERHFAMRSRIGRVFEGQAWIENLNVDENVILARRHHDETDATIDQDAQHWAERLGLTNLSQERPAFLAPSLLQIHQWIRAFIGKPALLILERPMRSVSLSLLPKFIEAVDDLRRRGTSVFWFTNNHAVVTENLSPPLFHFEVRNEELVQRNGDAGNE
jgi:phospholipid/cholesterol/gamma-HCH transport system ATP-binding protein